jgi:cytolysin-activating lysine-acyltransferase
MTAESPASAPAPPPKTVAQMLGEIVWLLTQSPLHRQMFLSDLEWFCLPPLLLEQYRIFYGPNAPAAAALWARVSEATDRRLAGGGQRLQPEEWSGGDIPWLIELVAPFGAQDEILRDLAESVFAGRPFKFHYVTPTGQRAVRVYDPAVDAP